MSDGKYVTSLMSRSQQGHMESRFTINQTS